jgi:NTP pyrophosphatase (non-canonical NTP hydrolase)
MSDVIKAEIDRLIGERDEARAEVERLRRELAELPSENQETIAAWRLETFGKTTLFATFKRARKEWRELQDRIDAHAKTTDLAAEVADIVIVLYAFLEIMGLDLHEAIDRKMAINRSREWVLNGDGTGQHRELAGDCKMCRAPLGVLGCDSCEAKLCACCIAGHECPVRNL